MIDYEIVSTSKIINLDGSVASVIIISGHTKLIALNILSVEPFNLKQSKWNTFGMLESFNTAASRDPSGTTG